jgi:hypothetical protein
LIPIGRGFFVGHEAGIIMAIRDQNASGAASWRGGDEAIQSVYNIVKAPLEWSIYSDGVKLVGIYGSKEAAFEAATVAAMFAVRDGAGVQINIPSEGEERTTGRLNLHRSAPSPSRGWQQKHDALE